MKISTRIKKFFSVKNIIITALVVVAIVLAGIAWGPQLLELFTDAERIKALIKSAGPWGPILFILLQAAQTIIAPIPGNITAAVGGVAFGGWGLLLTVIGSAIGFAVVVAISRKWGRPLLERFFSKAQVAKLDWIIQHKGAPLILFLIFLFPFMPDDIVGYLAGLTPIPFKNLMWLSILGKLPLQAATNFFGVKLIEGNIFMVVGILLVVAAVIVVFYLKRRWIGGFLKSDDHGQYLKDSIKRKKKVQLKDVSKDNSK